MAVAMEWLVLAASFVGVAPSLLGGASLSVRGAGNNGEVGGPLTMVRVHLVSPSVE